MSSTPFRCPNCNEPIELTDAIARPIREQLERSLQAEREKHQRALAAREKELAERELAIRAKSEEFEKLVAAEVKQREQRIAAEQARLAAERTELQLKELSQKLADREAQRNELISQILDLKKQQDQFEQEKQAIELEKRRLAEATRAAALREAEEKSKLKEAEHQQLISQMKQRIEELNRRIEQGSQQTQGEAMEINLERDLREVFRFDEIEPIEKGVRGGDILQRVRTGGGADCGSILWESKQTKSFSKAWLDKLKEDKRKVGAAIAILVTQALPANVNGMDQLDGVWVVSPPLAMQLCGALRQGLIDTAAARSAIEGKADKAADVYDYLTGPAFKERVEAIVDSFVAMKDQIDAERRAMEKQWAAREMQLKRLITGTTRMYGEIGGIVGGALPRIEKLELPALPGESFSNEPRP